jgi:membrane protein DedA with SNARE-associated domain
MTAIEQAILVPGLLSIVALILLKEAGVPIPVPGDLVVIGAGVVAGRGDLDPSTTLLAIVVASIVGGAIQYGLLRSVARPALLRLLRRVASAERVDRQADRLRRGGVRSVAVARCTPGVRIVAIAASALAAVPGAAFLAGLTIGNALFITVHFALGYLVGEPVIRALGGALVPIAIGAMALALFGALGWIVVNQRRGRADTRNPLAAVGDWADACCPACLTLAAVEARRPG